MDQTSRGVLALFLALSMLLSLSACGGGEDAQAAMHLVQTEGTVRVTDAKGKPVEPAEALALHSGYGVATQAASFAWLEQDGVKRAKLDEGGEVELQEDGKLLELFVRSGGLFFCATGPLAEDEAMNIRTSLMRVCICDACGWVEAEGENLMCVYLLTGQAECTVLDQRGSVLARQTIAAGQAAKMEADGSITAAEFDTYKSPDFVKEALMNSDAWQPRQEQPEASPDSNDTGLAVKAPVKGPKMLRSVEYLADLDVARPSAYFEYIYDEQGNNIGYEEYKHGNTADEWKHFRHVEFTYDSQGRVQEMRTHTFSDDGDLDSLMTQVESGPDYVALGYPSGGAVSRMVYFYNDLGQCVRKEFVDGIGNAYNYTTYQYDDQGKITEEKLYYPISDRGGEYKVSSYRVYEYEGDASLLDVIHPAQPQTDESQPAQSGGTGVSLADFVGTYTPYDAYSYYSGGACVTMNADGVFTGGETDGRTPTSISRNEDGSIVILFGDGERYTIYPVGVATPSYFGDVNTAEVNIEYLYTAGGAMNIVYHADPATLGAVS